jgi:hypothetical protein
LIHIYPFIKDDCHQNRRPPEHRHQNRHQNDYHQNRHPEILEKLPRAVEIEFEYRAGS